MGEGPARIEHGDDPGSRILGLIRRSTWAADPSRLGAPLNMTTSSIATAIASQLCCILRLIGRPYLRKPSENQACSVCAICLQETSTSLITYVDSGHACFAGPESRRIEIGRRERKGARVMVVEERMCVFSFIFQLLLLFFLYFFPSFLFYWVRIEYWYKYVTIVMMVEIVIVVVMVMCYDGNQVESSNLG
ncbi:hypothetical protein F4809DRAFT_83633 [Biscogniauxia mediterranea]|nr:hypothetical protein F4809DRAFT_83633 [Biscogniauxia mediterranea]